MAATISARPLLGTLCSALPSVLEHNVGEEGVRHFKLGSIAFIQQLATALHERLPVLSPAQYEELFHHTFELMVGLWPLAHPAPVVARVLEAPELVAFRHDFERDLARGISLIARGLLSEA